MKRCPGSLSFSQPKIEMIPCPDCGADVEIWSDEATGQCPKCSRTVIRTASQSCVDWCRYAVECLGDEKFKKYGEMKAALRKSALINAIQLYCEDNPARIARARKILAYAEAILPGHKEADPNVVMAASALHSVVLTNVESQPGRMLEATLSAERLPLALKILKELGYPEGLMNEVSDLLSEDPGSRRKSTIHYKLLHDAVLLADSEKLRKNAERDGLSESLKSAFLTETALAAAAKR